MSAQFAIRLLPPTQRLGRTGQAGVHAEGMQQAVWVQAKKVAFVPLGVFEEWAREQAHILHGKGSGLGRGGRLACKHQHNENTQHHTSMPELP
jgi:hypothetical protein